MTSPTKRTNLKRAGLVLLSVTVLVGTGTVAWGHSSASTSIPDPADGRIHACFPNNNPRTLRVIAPTQTCTSSQSGVDWPANGVLTQMEETALPAVDLPVPAGGPGATASMTLTCPANKVVIGLSDFNNTVATGVAALAGITRGGGGNSVTVTFASLTASAAAIGGLRALCVTQFAQ